MAASALQGRMASSAAKTLTPVLMLPYYNLLHHYVNGAIPMLWPPFYSLHGAIPLLLFLVTQPEC